MPCPLLLREPQGATATREGLECWVLLVGLNTGWCHRPQASMSTCGQPPPPTPRAHTAAPSSSSAGGPCGARVRRHGLGFSSGCRSCDQLTGCVPQRCAPSYMAVTLDTRAWRELMLGAGHTARPECPRHSSLSQASATVFKGLSGLPLGQSQVKRELPFSE